MPECPHWDDANPCWGRVDSVDYYPDTGEQIVACEGHQDMHRTNTYTPKHEIISMRGQPLDHRSTSANESGYEASGGSGACVSVRDPAQPGAVPLDPKVRAQIRREEHDKGQLWWDKSTDAPTMLTMLVEARGADPAILLPPVKFMAAAERLLTERGGQLDGAILQGVIRTTSRRLVQGRFWEACLYLQHAWGGIKAEGTSNAMMSDLVREFFPDAPTKRQLPGGPPSVPGRLDDRSQ